MFVGNVAFKLDFTVCIAFPHGKSLGDNRQTSRVYWIISSKGTEMLRKWGKGKLYLPPYFILVSISKPERVLLPYQLLFIPFTRFNSSLFLMGILSYYARKGSIFTLFMNACLF